MKILSSPKFYSLAVKGLNKVHRLNTAHRQKREGVNIILIKSRVKCAGGNKLLESIINQSVIKYRFSLLNKKIKILIYKA